MKFLWILLLRNNLSIDGQLHFVSKNQHSVAFFINNTLLLIYFIKFKKFLFTIIIYLSETLIKNYKFDFQIIIHAYLKYVVKTS